MKRLFPYLLILISYALSSCAGTPVEEEIDETALKLIEAEKLMEIASPMHLREALKILTSSKLQSDANAGRLAALAGEVFTFLYPELDHEPCLEGLPPISGPYKTLFASALMGEGFYPDTGTMDKADFWNLTLPSFYLLKNGLGASQQELKNLKLSLDIAGNINQDSVLPPFFKGLIVERQGELSMALSFYAESAAKSESFYPAILRLALLKIAAYQPEAAVPLLEKVLKAIPKNSFVRARAAEAYFAAKEFDKASALVAEELLKDPEDTKYLLLRSRILRESGNWPQAFKPLNMVLLKQPKTVEAYLLKADILHENSHDTEAALVLLREAEELIPEDPRIPEKTGKILLESGKSEEGLMKLNRAIELDPDRISTLRLLMQDALKLKRWLQAAIYLSRILEQEETEQDLVSAHQIFVNLGDAAQALYYAEKLYQMGSTDAFIPIYAKALVLNQNLEQARAVIEKGLEHISDPYTRSELLLLKALDKDTDPDARLKFLQESLLENPDNLETLLKISDLYIDRQDYRKARLFLKRAVEIDPNNPGLRIQLNLVESSLQPSSKH